MKTKTACTAALIVGLSLIHFPRALGQGSLEPPPGPPAPTMKTLDQVEARTAIDPSQPGFTLPYTISQSGSYYLARNVTATASAVGIIIAADDVTVDLNGFALNGAGVGTKGIDVPAARKNLTIRNGTVRGWTQGGVRADFATNCILEKLRASGNTGGSLVGALVAGNGSLITDCVAASNTSSTNGIKTFSGTTIVNCSASSNGGSGIFVGGTSTISNCTTNGNSVYGIRAFSTCTLTHCNAGSNASVGISTGDGCTVTDCTAAVNTGSGIEVANGSTVRNCTAYSNSGGSAYGILAGVGCTLSGCTAYANTLDGIFTLTGCSVRDCTASSNQGSGLLLGAGNTVTASTSFGNVRNGIEVGSGTAVRDCASRSNGITGITIPSDCYVFGNNCTANAGGMAITGAGSNNRVDSNTFSANTGGGFSGSGPQNFIIRNTAKGNGGSGFSQTYVFTLGAGDEISSVSYGNSWANYEK